MPCNKMYAKCISHVRESSCVSNLHGRMILEDISAGKKKSRSKKSTSASTPALNATTRGAGTNTSLSASQDDFLSQQSFDHGAAAALDGSFAGQTGKRMFV